MAFFLLPALRRSSRLTISSQPPSTKRIIYSEVLVFTTLTFAVNQQLLHKVLTREGKKRRRSRDTYRGCGKSA
ncbi:hypothetical protein IGI04_014783 [Brassica rapa subsp. trilocularis]|uniref:Secreted protein n=1 Tax=Brassica rapa subsp. trilocularis TaxID=1813537 RepID=A0ABQ7MR86_BRACM|nr:hypothetical protein IGI04_014783 [Brassica rapa subsp. trilocularis]